MNWIFIVILVALGGLAAFTNFLFRSEPVPVQPETQIVTTTPNAVVNNYAERDIYNQVFNPPVEPIEMPLKEQKGTSTVSSPPSTTISPIQIIYVPVPQPEVSNEPPSANTPILEEPIISFELKKPVFTVLSQNAEKLTKFDVLIETTLPSDLSFDIHQGGASGNRYISAMATTTHRFILEVVTSNVMDYSVSARNGGVEKVDSGRIPQK